ncbi:MAG TPA: 5'-nucleotidase C-terminal domain-containing protein, partial [Savagea sp.]
MTFGNHEFDLGSSPEGHKALAEFVEKANFSMLAGNIDFSGDPLFKDLIEGKDAKIKPYIIEEVNGEKYGIFGLTTPDTAGISSPGEVKFAEDYIAEAKEIVAKLEAQGINRIIAVTHIGNEAIEGTANDQALAAGVPEIDIIVGGHSHSKVEPPQKVDNGKHGPTIIVQANEYSKYLGTLDVSFDGNGVITKHRGELIEVAKKAPNADALEVLKPYKEQVEKKMNEKIGVTLKTTLTNPRGTPISVRSHETALGNIITDGMLAKAKQLEGENAERPTIFAMQNGGGIRVPIEAGEVTTGQIIAVLPFGNTLAHVSLTGKEIKEVFEHSFAKFPEEEGGFLHIAGGKVEVDTSQPSGERVISVSYEGKDGEWVALDLTNDEELFKIATNAFTAKGGDAYTTLGKAYEEGRGGDYGDSEADWENLRNRLVYLQENNIEITDQPAGRIIDKNQK